MTILSVSPSGTASLAQLINNPPASASVPTIVGDGSVNRNGAKPTLTEAGEPLQLLRAFSPDALLDKANSKTSGRFVDVTA